MATASVAAILIKLKRVQRELVRVQAEVVAWDDNQTNGEVKAASDFVKELKKRTESLQDQFDQIATDDEATNNEPTFETIAQSILHLIGAINDVSLARIQSKEKDHVFKFDKLKLPSFSGEFSEWQEFADLFKAAIHNNGTMSGGAKMIHLRDALKGEAATIIKNTPATDAGYKEAWKKVEARYSNKREIVFAHLRKFHELKHQPDTSKGLRKLCDTVNECTRSLRLLQVEIGTWDAIMVFLSLTKLDEETKRQWLLLQDNELPKLVDLLEYLEKRATALAESPKSSSKAKSTPFASSHHTTSDGQSSRSCINCKENHSLFYCPKFKALTVSDRLKFVAEQKVCPNCFSADHQYTRECKSKYKCKICDKSHNTLVHYEKRPRQQGSHQSNATQGSPSGPPPVIQSTTEAGGSSSNQPVLAGHTTSGFYSNRVVLMATVIVKVRDSNGEFHPCRVFLDSGSEANFVSEHLVNLLNLRRENSCVRVTGIGGGMGDTARGLVSFGAHSFLSSFVLPVKALILPKITGLLPREKCQTSFPHLVGLTLADPNYHIPAPVDILLGADAASKIILPGLKRGKKGSPLAQNSKFGWFLTGGAPVSPTTFTNRRASFTVTVCHSTCAADERCLESSLQRFWELEDPAPAAPQISSDDQLSEEHFLSTFTRDSEGRYGVSLPFAPDCGTLGDSRQKAISCFRSLEKQFQKDHKLRDAYHSQIKDYIAKEWVQAVPPSQLKSQRVSITTTGGDELLIPPFYMPHHVVVKPDSTTTKFRIVFNASAKTDSGNSLNSLLLSGPKIQTDLHPLLTRFRTHPIAVGADIVKFYHQVKVNPSHWNFQRFVWRKETTDPFTDLQFTRLTFGVTSAPFLAIRSLRQLGEDCKEEFPLAQDSIQNDFLVDNLLFGAQTFKEAMEIKEQLIQVLSKGKFPLQKWISNQSQVLNSIPPEERETFSFNIQEDESIKTIGLFWHPTSDTFGVKISAMVPLTTATKREVLSHTARVFDPLQWLSPVTIAPKILLQTLWKEKLGWDEQIPAPLFQKWKKYCQELDLLRQFRIPRCLTFSSCSNPSVQHELFGFCDASNQAYSACVYLRSTTEGTRKSQLIECKSKVAPVHGETTPKLELCGAELLVKLINSVSITLSLTKINVLSVSCFTDSTGVLGQLFSQEKQPVFVANRVRKIRQSPVLIHWYHVPGDKNPADLPSRGIPAQSLLDNLFWLHGPTFLVTGEFPPQPYTQTVASFATSISEGQNFVNVHLTRLISSESSFPKMKRLIGYWIRFINNSNKKRIPIHGPLTSVECEKAIIPIVKCVQSACYKDEIERCTSSQEVKSQIRFLSPFLDKNGILRVGGRLRNSSLPFQSQHPILLPKCHSRPSTPVQKQFGHFVWSVARDFHLRNLHAAPKLLLSLIRSEYWIPRGQDLCSRIFRQCIPCFKQNPHPLTQIMGQLPASRVVPDFPFLKVGLDYAGPFTLAAVPGRNPRLLKAWVCVFVCMSTKAVHLEFSGGLSTPDFISALQRFCSIRNSPSDIYCDGGTNFLGAKNDMDSLQALVRSDPHRERVSLFLTGEKVNYHFNPPLGPHHGGLWEAAVKSMKLHLARIMQGHHLSIEEFITLLARISAALNSRPLTPVSNNPDDVRVLTPFHFLTLRGPKEVAEIDVTTMKSHRSRWQLVQQMTQHLFRRWSQDYLHHLQNRSKWLQTQPNISKGTMVLLHDADSSLGPQRWNLGRIEAVFPGKDGRVRICDVRIPIPKPEDLTPKPGEKPNWKFKIFRRPITRISPLPFDDDVRAAFVLLR